MKYSDFVDFGKLNPFKKKVLKILRSTSDYLLPLRIKLLSQSLGEPAALLDFLDYDFLLAFKSDGVGTKSKIAEIIGDYSNLGIDLIAMNANDIICVGATPIALSDEVASGSSFWFNNQKKVDSLLLGFKKGCQLAGIIIPCGETPTLPDIIFSDTVNITGSMIGIVRPKSKAILGNNLREGDVIYGLASSGIHANGLTLARKIVEKLPQGYFSPFEKTIIGKELLKPTKIYVEPILTILKKEVEIHYMTNITGGGFKKIMRAKKSFIYFIEKLPPKPKIFEFLQKKGNVPDIEAYQTWNMGIGFIIFAPEKEEELIRQICKEYKIDVYKLGRLKKGKRQVVIKPLNIRYIGENN